MFSTVTEMEVILSINEIIFRAVGTDEIDIRIIKPVGPYNITAVSHLVNRSLIAGISKILENEYCTSTSKKTCLSDVSHFRPISMLPSISKVMEKIVIRQMSKNKAF